ncbi:MAG TPA: chloride channel protein [Geothrix sp.]|nr:chloride channel protein [Geothrix sp.]
MPELPEPATFDPKHPLALPSRLRSLRMIAQARRLALAVLPLGAVIGLLVALALAGMTRFQELITDHRWHTFLLVASPLVGLVLTGIWLKVSRIGEVSLVKDLVEAHADPLGTFRFWPSLGKTLACALTIGFGGSAGIEGPAKWLGAALGAQFHGALRWFARRWPRLRRVLVQPRVMVMAGSAAALAAVFRAPLSGALLAAEHEGELNATQAAPALVASATGYLAFIALRGTAPLLGIAAPYTLKARELFWALPLGLACALAASLFRRLLRFGRHHLRPLPLSLRGLVAGLGLVILALPGAWLWPGLPVTQGGGLDLVTHVLHGGTPSSAALTFFALKLTATALTFAGGGVGGTWLPSVTIGACLGAAFDAWAGLGQPGLFALVGASAFAGAVHRTLLTPVVFLAETTGQAALVVPALVATVAAFQGTRNE